MQDVRWTIEAAYTLWRRGKLPLRMSLKCSGRLKRRFYGQWSGRKAAEWQLEQWQH